MLAATCRLRRVEVNAAALDALDPAPPAPRPLRAKGSARALDADDPAPAAAPAGGRRLDDLHAQQLAAVYAAAVYAAAGRQQLSAGGRRGQHPGPWLARRRAGGGSDAR